MIQGFLESAAPDLIQGWAFDDEAPTVRLVVRARRGVTELGHAEASASRPDLRGKWGDNDGNHGFTFEIAPSLTRQQVAEITIEVARPGAAEWHPLPRYVKSDAVITDAIAATTKALTASLQEMVRHIAEAAKGTTEKAELTQNHVIHVPDTTGLRREIEAFWSDDPGRKPLAPEESFPVFVTGSVRSGTSAICWALMRATRYRGFLEGHVLDVAFELTSVIEAHFESKKLEFPAAIAADFHLGLYSHRRFHVVAQRVLRGLAAGYTTPFWVDKTPSLQMVRSVPILARTWPNARFIFMKRRGLENVMSRLRKFPTARFDGSCRRWASIMAEWRTVRASVPGKSLEIDQRTLLDKSDTAAELAGAFLDLGDPEVEALALQLRDLRPEVTDPTARVLDDVSETGWSSEQIAAFRVICGPEMEAYGYTYDGRYSE
jgi:hypothetical protein